MNGIIPRGSAAGYDTMLSLRSFGNELVHSSHFAWESSVRKTGRFLPRLQLDIAYLSIPTRPPAEKYIQAASPEAINFAYQIISRNVNKVELLTGYEGIAFSYTGNVHNDILSITAVHPMRRDAVDEILNKTGADWNLVEKMLRNGEIIQSDLNGKKFFLRNF